MGSVARGPPTPGREAVRISHCKSQTTSRLPARYEKTSRGCYSESNYYCAYIGNIHITMCYVCMYVYKVPGPSGLSFGGPSNIAAEGSGVSCCGMDIMIPPFLLV